MSQTILSNLLSKSEIAQLVRLERLSASKLTKAHENFMYSIIDKNQLIRNDFDEDMSNYLCDTNQTNESIKRKDFRSELRFFISCLLWKEGILVEYQE
jgi:hypothetical protein